MKTTWTVFAARQFAPRAVAGLFALVMSAQAAVAAPFPAEIDLSSLLTANGGNGSAGFALNGIVGFPNGPSDFSGFAVSAAGDINGDGIGDVVVGAIGARSSLQGDAGQSYVVFGRAGGFPAEFELSSLLSANGGNGSAGFVLNGIEFGDDSGHSVSAAGDVNGDGVGDLLVGAPNAEFQSNCCQPGEAYVIFGRNPAAGGFPAEFELSSLLPTNGGNGSAGFVIFTSANGLHNAGYAVSGAGDVNGDGTDDVLVGAPSAAPAGRHFAGRTYVVFGRPQAPGGPPVFAAKFDLSSLLAVNGGNGSAGFVLHGIDGQTDDTEDVGDLSGSSLGGAGDVNGDGVDDIVVGAPNANPHGRQDAGQAYVLFGRSRRSEPFPAEIELSGLLAANGGNGSTGFALNGVNPEDATGQVSAAGDVNGDGSDDLLVGAPLADPGGRVVAGRSYVVYGRSGGGFSAEFELSTLLAANGGNGSTGFALNGIEAGDGSGVSVSDAGDVNADGVDDLLIGANLADPATLEFAGQSYVVFGREQALGGFPAEFELSGLLAVNGGNGSTGFVLNGVAADDFSSQAVSSAGDINGDGIDDVIIGAPGADPGGRNTAGQSYVVFGRLTPPTCGGVTATIVGTDSADFLVGTPRPDVIVGFAGNDVIIGLAGNDIICGGRGNDLLFSNTGDDRVLGDDGFDSVFGGFGDDQLDGGGGDDRLFGEAGRDAILGGTGNDALFGAAGDDRLAGGDGNDRLLGEAGNDSMDGGANVDRCNGGGGNGDSAANCEQVVNVP